jgi:hypothetical protein
MAGVEGEVEGLLGGLCFEMVRLYIPDPIHH